MAILLFLLDKTPSTVLVLLIAMVVLAIYPVLHFVVSIKKRIVTITAVVITTTLLGFKVWPKRMSEVTETLTIPVMPTNRTLVPGERTLTVAEQSEVNQLQKEYIKVHPDEPKGSLLEASWINAELMKRGRTYTVIPKPFNGEGGVYLEPGITGAIVEYNSIGVHSMPGIVNNGSDSRIDHNQVTIENTPPAK